MMEHITLQESPKIEFLLQENGFQLIDEQSQQNSGFYAYSDLRSIELDKLWFHRLAKFLRVFSWMLNGVPLFPKGEDCKVAKVTMQFQQSKLGMWLTDSAMTDKAKMLKKAIELKAINQGASMQ